MIAKLICKDCLTTDASKTVIQGTVISHLDYSNSILSGLPKCDIQKLQRVQIVAAKVIVQKKSKDSITECRAELHWLPVQARIDFKVLVMVFKCLTGEAPSYLKNLLKKQRSGCDDRLLSIPFTRRKTFADRSFSVYSPRLRNSLPYFMRSIDHIDNFKKQLKTYFFRKIYD